MILIFGKPVHVGDTIRSPIARHAADRAIWRDTVSYDTALVMTELDIQLPEDVIEAIRSDPDVLFIVDLDPDPPIPGPESGDSGEKNPDKKISDAGWANAQYGLSRLEIPEDAINRDMSYEMIVNVFRDRMIINQALGDLPPDAPLETARKVRERLNAAGYDVPEETAEDIREVIKESVKKGAVGRDHPRKR